MNPFIQDIDRILDDKPNASKKSPLSADSSEFSEVFNPFSLSTPTPTAPDVTLEQISLQDISNGFELQSRRYDRFLSTDN